MRARAFTIRRRRILQTVTGATNVEDRPKRRPICRPRSRLYDAAKKVYDSRVDLQKQGALAQKPGRRRRSRLVQALRQLDTAKQHLETLSTVGQREQVGQPRHRSTQRKPITKTPKCRSATERSRSPISGMVADRPVYPGETAAAAPARFDRGYLERGGARQIPVKEPHRSKWGDPRRSRRRMAISPARLQ